MRECPRGSITPPPQVASAFISCLLEQTPLPPRPGMVVALCRTFGEMPFPPLRSLMITPKLSASCEAPPCAVMWFVNPAGTRRSSAASAAASSCRRTKHEAPPPPLPAGRLTRRPGAGMPRQGGEGGGDQQEGEGHTHSSFCLSGGTHREETTTNNRLYTDTNNKRQILNCVLQLIHEQVVPLSLC